MGESYILNMILTKYITYILTSFLLLNSFQTFAKSDLTYIDLGPSVWTGNDCSKDPACANIPDAAESTNSYAGIGINIGNRFSKGQFRHWSTVHHFGYLFLPDFDDSTDRKVYKYRYGIGLIASGLDIGFGAQTYYYKNIPSKNEFDLGPYASIGFHINHNFFLESMMF